MRSINLRFTYLLTGEAGLSVHKSFFNDLNEI